MRVLFDASELELKPSVLIPGGLILPRLYAEDGRETNVGLATVLEDGSEIYCLVIDMGTSIPYYNKLKQSKSYITFAPDILSAIKVDYLEEISYEEKQAINKFMEEQTKILTTGNIEEFNFEQVK